MLNRVAERAHDTDGTAFFWHAAHLAVGLLGLVLTLGEVYYHGWAARHHWRSWR